MPPQAPCKLQSPLPYPMSSDFVCDAAPKIPPTLVATAAEIDFSICRHYYFYLRRRHLTIPRISSTLIFSTPSAIIAFCLRRNTATRPRAAVTLFKNTFFAFTTARRVTIRLLSLTAILSSIPVLDDQVLHVVGPATARYEIFLAAAADAGPGSTTDALAVEASAIAEMADLRYVSARRYSAVDISLSA